MSDTQGDTINRRELIISRVPACAAACIMLGRIPVAAGSTRDLEPQDQHKFDVPRERSMTGKQSVQSEYGNLFDFIRVLQRELEKPELLRLLNEYSAELGRQVGESQRQNAPDTSFQTFVATFRPPRYAGSLTHEVVEDTEKAFGLRVTECIWATVFREAGLDGEIGHAALCNMDYHWPPTFNPTFRMERNQTLMQGHDHCNHRYIDTSL